LEAIFIFIFGVIIGSFLGVCIYRLPRGQSIAVPPSHCPHCSARLGILDLIPLLSYISSRGRCRYCQRAISPRYFVVELLTALLFLWCYYAGGLNIRLAENLVLTSFLIVIAFIDYDWQLILDNVLLLFAATGAAISFALGTGLREMLLAAVAGGGILLAVALISRGGMGGGDIKFVAALGFWLGWPDILLAIFLSFLLGGVVSLILLILRLKGRKDMIPFGPFIAAATYLTVLYGTQILDWYLRRVFS